MLRMVSAHLHYYAKSMETWGKLYAEVLAIDPAKESTLLMDEIKRLELEEQQVTERFGESPFQFAELALPGTNPNQPVAVPSIALPQPSLTAMSAATVASSATPPTAAASPIPFPVPLAATVPILPPREAGNPNPTNSPQETGNLSSRSIKSEDSTQLKDMTKDMVNPNPAFQTEIKSSNIMLSPVQ